MPENARKCTIAAERLSAICWRLLKLCGGVSIDSGIDCNGDREARDGREARCEGCNMVDHEPLANTSVQPAGMPAGYTWKRRGCSVLQTNPNKPKQTHQKTSLAKRK
jgi:hypothetical protein